MNEQQFDNSGCGAVFELEDPQYKGILRGQWQDLEGVELAAWLDIRKPANPTLAITDEEKVLATVTLKPVQRRSEAAPIYRGKINDVPVVLYLKVHERYGEYYQIARDRYPNSGGPVPFKL